MQLNIILMKNFHFIAAAFVIFLMAGCNPFQRTNWVKMEKDSYTIMLPDYMTPQTDLHEDANLQYANIEKEVYIVVLEEPAIDFETAFADTSLGYPPTMQGYSDLIYEEFKLNMDSSLVSISERQIQKEGNVERHTFNSVATLDTFDAYYEFGIVRNDSTYYQIIAWTLADRKEQYKDDLAKMVKSLMPK